MGGVALSWIDSFNRERTQVVRINDGTFSKVLEVWNRWGLGGLVCGGGGVLA